MKGKHKHKRTVSKPVPRNTRSKRIGRLAKKNPREALEFALYGEPADAVSKLHMERRMDGKTISDFIQNWLFIAECEADPKLKKDEALAWKRREMESRAALFLAPIICDRICEKDADYFHNFADTLDREVAIRKAAMLEDADRTTAEFKLLAQTAYSGQPVNLYAMAREIVDKSFTATPSPKDKAAQERIERTRDKRMASSRRSLSRIAKRLGVKTLPVGRPPKSGHLRAAQS